MITSVDITTQVADMPQGMTVVRDMTLIQILPPHEEDTIVVVEIEAIEDEGIEAIVTVFLISRTMEIKGDINPQRETRDGEVGVARILKKRKKSR